MIGTLARLLSPPVALAAIVLSAAAMMTGHASAQGVDTGGHSRSPEELRQTCSSGSQPSPARSSTDPQEIIARRDRALAACDRLIDGGRIAEADLAAALLDRADVLAPGTGRVYARALADYQRAITLAPNVATAFSRRGKAHLLYGRDLRKALQDLDTAIRLDPLQADFFVTRASIQAWLNAPDKALVEIDRAIGLAPASEKARSVRGLLHLDRGDYALAIADFDEAIRLAPESDENYAFRAAAKRAAGDREGAQADEAKALERSLRNNAPAPR